MIPYCTYPLRERMLKTRLFFFLFYIFLSDDMKYKKDSKKKMYGGHVDKDSEKDGKEDKVGRSTETTKPPMPRDLKT